MLIAGGIGLVAGVGGEALILLASAVPGDASALERSAAVLYAAAWWVLWGFAAALCGCRLLASRAGRVVAIGFSAFALSALTIVTVSGVVLRAMSGSYLTVAALDFMFGATSHFLHAALGSYSGTAAALFLVLVGLGGGIAWLLRPAARRPARPSARALGVIAAVLAFVVVVYGRRSESRFTRDMFLTDPLLALVDSLDDSFEAHGGIAPAEAGELPGAMVEPGPPLAAGNAWKERASAAKGPRPNVLLVVLESVSIGHTSLYGYERPTTPNLARLASEGLWLRHTWTTATHSNYAQPAILSSLLPRRYHGHDQYETIDYPRFLFHDAFAALGYDVATISSQDETWQGMLRFQETGTPQHYWYSADYAGDHIDIGSEVVVPDEVTADTAMQWLGRDRDRPWALYVNLQNTHFPYGVSSAAERPWLPDEPTASTFHYLGFPESDREAAVNRYDNALHHVDAQLGRLYAWLAERGVLDDTLVMVTADHGEMFFEKGMVTHGKTLYEMESRVPLVVRWPGHVPVEVRDEPVSQLDLMPTLLDLLELPPHPSWQGTSARTPRPRAPLPVYITIQGLRLADGLVCWPWKLVVDRTDRRVALYDLAHDPDEQEDLVVRNPVVAQRLHDTLERQIQAQLDYHAEPPRERYQPRLLPCPAL
jgi:arylsulfatase A-like enzyme